MPETYREISLFNVARRPGWRKDQKGLLAMVDISHSALFCFRLYEEIFLINLKFSTKAVLTTSKDSLVLALP